MAKLIKNRRLLDCPETFYSSVLDLQSLQQNNSGSSTLLEVVSWPETTKTMLAYIKELLEYLDGYMSINPKLANS
jgi:hypothetical protein